MPLERAPGESGLWARKSVAHVMAQAQRNQYRRSLGALDLTAIGIAGIIGAGIFGLIGAAAGAYAGPAILVSILIAGTGAVLAALSYGELASMIPASGSAYHYAYAGLGRLPAFLMGWLILNAYAVGNMTVAIVWSSFLVEFLGSLGGALPLSLTTDPSAGGLGNVPAALIMAAVTLLCLARVRESAGINNLLVGLKLALVLIVIVAGVLFIDPTNWHPFSPGGASGIVAASALILFAYLGFDTVAATGEEARNPRRDLPLGILASVGVSALLYVAMGAVITGMAAAPDIDADTPVQSAFRLHGVPWVATMVGLGSLVALTTVLYAFQLALPRILHAMAIDGFLPRRLGQLHPRTGIPWALNLWTGGLTAVGAALLPLLRVADMTVLAAIYVYVLVMGGVLALRWVEPDTPRPFRVPRAVPVVGILLLLVLAYAGIQNMLVHVVFVAWVGLGLAAYGFYAHGGAVRASSKTIGASSRGR